MPDNKILVSRPYYTKVLVSVSRPVGQGLGLETWWPRSWSRDLVAKVLVLRPGSQGLGLELFSKILITSLPDKKHHRDFSTYQLISHKNEIKKEIKKEHFYGPFGNFFSLTPFSGGVNFDSRCESVIKAKFTK